MRQARAAPLLTDLKSWLHATVQREGSKKSELAGAIGYTLALWTALTRYVDDGRIEIDNNTAERALRTVALGRNYRRPPIMHGGHGARRGCARRGRSRLPGIDRARRRTAVA